MNNVTVTVTGKVGSGKSALCGEIEILCKALGLSVTWEGGQAEKNLTHADWTEALEMYRPSVTIVEQMAAPMQGADARPVATTEELYPTLSREEWGQVTTRVMSDRCQHDRANSGSEPMHDQVACSLANGRGNKCTCDAYDPPAASPDEPTSQMLDAAALAWQEWHKWKPSDPGKNIADLGRLMWRFMSEAARATPADRDSVIEQCAAVCHEAENGFKTMDRKQTASYLAAMIRALKSQQDAAIESQRSGDGS